jgi:hypothetical protein
MEHERTGDTVTLRFRRDFNWMAVRHLRHHVGNASRIRVDLSRTRFVDTEAIMALDALQREGRHVTLLDPPLLFEEVLDVLDLQNHFDVDTLIERRRTSSGLPA